MVGYDITVRLCSVDELLHLIDVLHSSRQVLITILGDQNVILDAYTANFPVLLQHFKVDVSRVNWVLQIRLDDEVAEVNLWFVSFYATIWEVDLLLVRP